MLRDKIAYFGTSVVKRLRGIDCTCPNCGATGYALADRKYLVTELRRCDACALLYRAPSDSAAENAEFYQEDYAQAFTTDVPDDAEFARHMANGFASPHHDYNYFITLLQALGLKAGDRLFDFGCSWGYGSWQLSRAGFNVLAYEISRPRAAFARTRLDVDVLAQLPDAAAPGALAGSFDVFFSSHVVEHVPRPSDVIALARALLKPGGYLVTITPNGAEAFRKARPQAWHQVWGKVHPNLLDDVFWRKALSTQPLWLGSSPVDPTRLATFHETGRQDEQPELSGGELVAIARL